MYLGRPASRAGRSYSSPTCSKAQEAAQAADESALLREPVERVDDASIHQTEVAAVERDLQVADRAQDAIERPIRQPLEQALASPTPHGVDDVVALAPEPNRARESVRAGLAGRRP